MHVVFVNSTRTWGGVKSWTVRLIRAFTAQSVRCTLVARDHREFIEKARQSGAAVSARHFGIDYSPLAVLRAFFMLRELKPDIIITNISKELRTFGMAARLKGIPVVARLGLASDLKENLRTRLDFRFLVSSILVPALFIKQNLPQRILGSAEIRVINTGIAVPDVCPPQPENSGETHIVYVGKISPRKGVPVLLGACLSLIMSGHSIRVSIAGEGPLLRELSGEYRNYPQIRFIGHLEDPVALIKSAHICIMHSEDEGLPNTLLEYMACGRAIVTTPCGGIPEMVESGAQALFVDFGDTDALVKELTVLIEHPELRAGLGKDAFERVQRDFNLEKQAQITMDFFKEVIKKDG
jgi:glycosyltransferase involved in cell wall biosynthesis